MSDNNRRPAFMISSLVRMALLQVLGLAILAGVGTGLWYWLSSLSFTPTVYSPLEEFAWYMPLGIFAAALVGEVLNRARGNGAMILFSVSLTLVAIFGLFIIGLIGSGWGSAWSLAWIAGRNFVCLWIFLACLVSLFTKLSKI